MFILESQMHYNPPPLPTVPELLQQTNSAGWSPFYAPHSRNQVTWATSKERATLSPVRLVFSIKRSRL